MGCHLALPLKNETFIKNYFSTQNVENLDLTIQTIRMISGNNLILFLQSFFSWLYSALERVARLKLISKYTKYGY